MLETLLCDFRICYAILVNLCPPVFSLTYGRDLVTVPDCCIFYFDRGHLSGLLKIQQLEKVAPFCLLIETRDFTGAAERGWVYHVWVLCYNKAAFQIGATFSLRWDRAKIRRCVFESFVLCLVVFRLLAYRKSSHIYSAPGSFIILGSTRMVWPFSSSASSFNSSNFESQSPSLPDSAGMGSTAPVLDNTLGSEADSTNMIGLDRAPIFALDQLKQAGVPFEKQLSPYLQMDPAVFRESTPQ
uniref:Uncharacterized protein n=1 Tax=Setaria digitata TaxID=48799 RepID=A0A915PWZ6_9BILA